MRFYSFLLGLIQTNMNSPEKELLPDADDMELSPVVSRKGLSRRYSSRKHYKRSNELGTSREKTPVKVISLKISPKLLNSHIPVPVKDVKDLKALKEVKKYLFEEDNPMDIHETCSNNGANEVVGTKVPSIDIGNNKESVQPLNLQNSSLYASETFLKRKSPILRQCSESESNVKDQRQAENNLVLNRIDIKNASGDIAEDEISSDNLISLRRTQVNMLYENKRFIYGSRSTLESATQSLSPSSKVSENSPRIRSPLIKSGHGDYPTIQEQCSQPNYSEIKDESWSVGTSEQMTARTAQAQKRSQSAKHKPHRNKVKSAFLNKDLLQFKPTETSKSPEASESASIKLTPSVAEEVLKWDEGDLDTEKTQEKAKFALGSEGFRGFTVEEIELTARKFEQCKSYQQRQLKTIVTTKKKLQQSMVKERGKLDDKMAVPYDAPNTTYYPIGHVDNNNLEGAKPDESIAVGTNNKVQICIGNNRIQINIKADKKYDSDKQNIDNKGEKRNSPGFWSNSIMASKVSDKYGNNSTKPGPTKRIYSNLEDYNSILHQSKRKDCEPSTSGFKSASGQFISQSEGHAIKMIENFPSTSGSRISKYDRIETGMDTDTTSRTDVFEASSDEVSRGKLSKSIPKYLQGRKMLKPRSLLAKLTPETVVSGSNIRKSLFNNCNGERNIIKENTKDCLEFGKVEAFKFDFKQGFSTASGRNINLSPKKLREASRMLEYDRDVQQKHFPTENEGIVNENTPDLKKIRPVVKKDCAKVIPPQKLEHLAGFSSASGRKLSVDPGKYRKAALLFPEDKDKEVQSQFGSSPGKQLCVDDGFTSASGIKLSVDLEEYQKAASIFPEEFNDAKETEDRKMSATTISEKITSNSCKSPKITNIANFAGFSSASGKKLTPDPEKLKRANKQFAEIAKSAENIANNDDKIKFESTISQDKEVTGIKHHRQRVSRDPGNIPKNSLQNIEFNKIGLDFNKFTGFTSASGRKISVDAGKLETASSLFEVNANKENSVGLASASEKKLTSNSVQPNTASVLFKNEEIMNGENTVCKEQLQSTVCSKECFGFSNASGSKIYIDDKKLNQARIKFGELDALAEESNPEKENSKAPSRTTHELIQGVQKYDQTLNSPSPKNPIAKEKIEKVKIVISSAEIVTTPLKPPLTTTTSNKKRLGMSRISNINSISKEKLDRARMLFDDCDTDLTITPMKTFSKNVKEFSTLARNNFQMSSPKVQQRQGERENTFLGTSTPLANKLENFTLDVTPIKNLPKVPRFPCNNQENGKEAEETDGLLLFREKSKSNLKELQSDIELEYVNLKRKLDVLEERKTCLEFQRHVINQSDAEYTRPRLGVLSIHKSGSKRIKLAELTSLTLENFDVNGIDGKIMEITPQNADKLHFNAAKDERAVVYTLDGAKVVPNTRNVIGVSEINNAFQAMHGIAPQLIPKGWVANHYRWIVWKLACYERKFPHSFRGCLSVESIIQQLKYRYDREIDRAERSAIARIVERDDVPNKRMVLCVAQIIQISTHKFELLLTDDWYSIKTIIDNLLIREVKKGKITIGTKLIIQGAELTDGEACHPLETPDHVKLKITYNNTRRAIWHLRLGYYHIPTPFPVVLRSVQPDGGQIARIKIYVMRIYPVRYMEEYNGIKIWRNAKSEDKRANEFECERNMEFEKIKGEVYDEYEANLRTNVTKINSKDLCSLQNPKELYLYIESSNDPESIYERLTPSQKSLLLDYKQKIMVERQREISERIAKRIDEKCLSNRIVTPMMKVLVSDAMEENSKCVVMNVWRPTEDQKTSLEEGHCLSIYNITMKRNNELSTLRRTMFQPHESLMNKRCQRQVLPISMTIDVYHKPVFNEFDTIGVVVDCIIREYDQELWLSDFTGRLLYVKIVDGPKHCSLLDSIKVGQTITCCNLILHSPQTEYGQSVANQHSTMSQFPQFKHLQEALVLFNTHLVDVSKLVNECRPRVENLRDTVNLKPNNNSYQEATFLDKVNANIFDDSDENATLPTGLTMLDVQMSLIDTDKFL